MKYKNKKFFNLEYAIVGFLTTGFLAFLINLDFNKLLSSVTSGLLQGIFSFMTLGISTAFFEYLHSRLKCKSFLLRMMSILLPALLSASASFVIHTFNATMRPLKTAIGVFTLAVFTFILMYLSIKRHKTIKPIDLLKILLKKN